MDHWPTQSRARSVSDTVSMQSRRQPTVILICACFAESPARGEGSAEYQYIPDSQQSDCRDNEALEEDQIDAILQQSDSVQNDRGDDPCSLISLKSPLGASTTGTHGLPVPRVGERYWGHALEEAEGSQSATQRATHQHRNEEGRHLRTIRRSEYEAQLDGMASRLQFMVDVLGEVRSQVRALKAVEVVPDSNER